MLKKYLMVSLLLTLMFMVSSVSIFAQEPDGSTQETAVQIEAVNEGFLTPKLNEKWYTFTVPDPAYRGTETLTLQLFYENGQAIDSSDRTRYNFNDFYLYSSTLGQVGSGKNWTGQIEGGTQYWVQVINESDFEVDYVLTYNSDYAPPSPEPTPEVVETDVEIVPEEPTPTDEVDIVPEEPQGVPSLTDDGATPSEATEFSLSSLTRGRVDSGTTGWRSVSFADPGNTNELRHLTITCFATPFDGNTVRDAQLRLYKIGDAQKWNYDNLDDLEELGAVEFNLRHNMAGAFGDGNTPAQFIWDGWVTAGDDYVLAVKNGTDQEIDYWCFPQQMDNAELGKRSVRVIPNFDPGQAPSNPIPFEASSEGKGNEVDVEVGVTPEQQLWYSFIIGDPGDGEVLEHVIIDMSFTPNNGAQGYNEAYRVNFDVYDSEDLTYWSQTDFDNVNVQSFGSGSAVTRDNNPDTGEMTWDGWVVDGNLYYVQVRNGARYPVDAKIVVRPVSAAGSNVVAQKPGIQ